MKIKGQNAFNPTLRLGYNLTSWLCVEAVGAFSFSEYTSTMENRHSKKNEQGSTVVDDPAMGEFDLEVRSMLTANAGVNATVYFLNLDGDGSGRLQPYATGGLSNMWYSMNSNYTNDSATSIDFNIGGGVRLLADRNISIRLEAVYHFNTLEFTPASHFTALDEGTVQVPLYEFPTDDEGVIIRDSVEEFSSTTMGSLGVSIGLQGSF